MEEAIMFKNAYNQLKKDGMVEKEVSKRVATGWMDAEYKVIEYKGLEFEAKQDESSCEFILGNMEIDRDVLIVNYHRDFYISRNDIITEEEVKELYRGERDWEATEKAKGYWMFELSCLIHGGVWLNFGGEGFACDSDGWDTSRVGLVLVSKKIARTKKQAEKLGRQLVYNYNKLLEGDVYYVKVLKDGKEIDSCGGLLGEFGVYQFVKEYTKK